MKEVKKILENLIFALLPRANDRAGVSRYPDGSGSSLRFEIGTSATASACAFGRAARIAVSVERTTYRETGEQGGRR